MKVVIQKIDKSREEQVVIQCYRITEEIEDIKQFIHTRGSVLEAFDESKRVYIVVSDIYYIEAVDDRVFVYLEEAVYEIKSKLYEFEEKYMGIQFFRCSKQNIINLLKVINIKPAMNGRFLAELSNGEEVIISRKYVSDFRKKIKGEVR